MERSNPDSSLEDRAEALRGRVDQLEKDISGAEADSRQRGSVGNAWNKLTSALGPLGKLLGWLFGLLARWIKWLAYDSSEAGLSFSLKRTVRNLAISLVAVIGLHATFKAIYFYSTYYEETVYVTGKQEIETGELYQFGGCTSLPCSTDSDNGKFYLIESSLYFPTLFYPEEDVFANIPQQNGACRVEGYGIYFRALRWLYKSAQLYQHVVDVSCRPYTQDEIRRAVEGGQIIDDQPSEASQ